jgi:MFS superfamily sulfate permease-like transporter
MNRYIFYLFVFKVAEVPGIKIFRFEANLYFANADQFRDRLYDKTRINPRKLKSKKQKVLYKSLLQRKREIELAEIDAKAERKRTKVRQSLVICVNVL